MEGKPISLFFTLFVLAIATIPVARAQEEHLVLEKTFSNKQIHFSSGDKISYKLKDEDFFRTDHIVALNHTAIKFHYHEIPYHEITAIHLKGKRFSGTNLRGIGGKLQFVGLGYIFVDMFNQVVVRGEDASFNHNIWIAGGLIYLSGTIMKLSQPKKVKLQGKYRLRYMPY
jgi:hypothetical protein